MNVHPKLRTAIIEQLTKDLDTRTDCQVVDYMPSSLQPKLVENIVDKVLHVLTFTCCKCNKPDAVIVAPQPICTECCENHDFQYSRDEQEHRCIYCDTPAPEDYYDQY